MYLLRYEFSITYISLVIVCYLVSPFNVVLSKAEDEGALPSIVYKVQVVGSFLNIWSALYVLLTEFFNYPSVMSSVLPVKKERLSHM